MFSKLSINSSQFASSNEYKDLPILDKYDVTITSDDYTKIASKATNLIRKSGYKVEVGTYGEFKIWKI